MFGVNSNSNFFSGFVPKSFHQLNRNLKKIIFLGNREIVMRIPTDSNAFPVGLVCDKKGDLYTVIYGGGKLHKIDPWLK